MKKKRFPKIYLSALIVGVTGIFLYATTFNKSDLYWYFGLGNSVAVWMIGASIIIPIIHWLIQPKTRIYLNKIIRSFFK